MYILFLAFLVGVLSGLRAFMSLVAVVWAARLNRLHLGGTKLAFLGFTISPYIATVLGLVEFVTDQLPSTPSRKVAKQFVPRLLLAAVSGGAIGIAGSSVGISVAAAVLGAVVGTYGGAALRASLAKLFKSDRPAAYVEDCVAIALAIFVVANL